MRRTRYTVLVALFFWLLPAAVGAQTGSESGVLVVGGERGWGRLSELHNLSFVSGFRNYQALRLNDNAYAADDATELLTGFDGEQRTDATGRYRIEGNLRIADRSLARAGAGAALFTRARAGISLVATDGRLFLPDTTWQDLSIEFWLYPAALDEGEELLQWEGFREQSGSFIPQSLAVRVTDRRLKWTFTNLFRQPDGERFTLSLEGRRGLVPRQWSHHLLRYNAETGLIEYVVDGEPEDVSYANRSGREAGTMFPLYIGVRPDNRMSVAGEFVGMIDELRIVRRFVTEPNLTPEAASAGSFTTEVMDLGFSETPLLRVERNARSEGKAAVQLYLRAAESTADFMRSELPWVPVTESGEPAQELSGRFVQLRGELLPGTPEDARPEISRVALHYEPNKPPNAPVHLTARAADGAVHLQWREVPAPDIRGYKVYYGRRPGNYFGTEAGRGPSPIDVGMETSLELDGLENGVLYFFAVAAYDASGVTHRTRFSEEASARPMRSPDD